MLSVIEKSKKMSVFTIFSCFMNISINIRLNK